jgi:hypothetical protein
MAVQMRPANIDWSALAGIGENVGSALAKRRQRQDFAGVVGPDGTFDYGKAMTALMQHDPQAAITLAAARERANEPPSSFREFQLAQQNPQFGNFLQDDKPTEAQRNAEYFSTLPEGDPRRAFAPRTGTSLSVTEKKEVFDAEDDLANIDATVETLNKALELNPQTMSGFGASALATYGAKAPSWLVPDKMEGPARATNEWQTIMSMEAIKNMSQTLKGVTTDFELRKFENVLADPSTPRDVRERTIKRMIGLAKRKSQILKDRLEGVRGGTYFTPRGGASGGQLEPGQVVNGYQYRGGNPNDQTSWEPMQ